MRKGLHIIRAMFPELSLIACAWCGKKLPCGDWVGPYRPALKGARHGDTQLCFEHAWQCSALEGQPPMVWHFRARGVPGWFDN
jgi:hypothetical protein